jgi:hypothetical protein
MGTEIIQNGGFETGNLTGWTGDGWVLFWHDFAHSGNYLCVLFSDSNQISQTFNVKVSDIEAFGYWYIFVSQVVVTFSDSSTYSPQLPEVMTWTYVDLKAWIQANKSPNLYVTKITLMGYPLEYGEASLVDDVSLIEVAVSTIEVSYGLDVILIKQQIKGRYCEKCGQPQKTLMHINNIDFCHYEWLCTKCYNKVTMNGKYLPYP